MGCEAAKIQVVTFPEVPSLEGMRWLKVLLTILAAVIAVAGGLITITAIAAGVLVLWAVQRWLGLLPPRSKPSRSGSDSAHAETSSRRSSGADIIDVTATEVVGDEQKT